jgi:hypothetical protein
MQIFEPFALKRIEDKSNPFSALLETEDGGRFYVEPAFYFATSGDPGTRTRPTGYYHRGNAALSQKEPPHRLHPRFQPAFDQC